MKELYQHFRESESAFINEVFDWLAAVQDNYAPYLTDFLNPRERYIVQSLVNRQADCQAEAFGGFVDAERQRMLLYPPYFTPENDDFELALLTINYPNKFTHISHGQVLGTLMGVGIKRAVIGDIITDGETIKFFSEQQLAAFLEREVRQIGRTAVVTQVVSIDQLVKPLNLSEEKVLSLTSLRMDVLVAGAFHLSRQLAKSLIQSERVKLNWAVDKHPQKELDYGDIVSVRHYGRVQLCGCVGQSRKGKLQVKVKVLASKRKK